MQYEHEAELAANIVIAAIQSGRIEVSNILRDYIRANCLFRENSSVL